MDTTHFLSVRIVYPMKIFKFMYFSHEFRINMVDEMSKAYVDRIIVES